MANISVNIDLLKLSGAVKRKSEKGNTYLAIPLSGNNIYEGEKGCYLKLVAVEYKEPKDQKTHFVKQEGKKEDNLPIIGDAIYWGRAGVTAPVVSADVVPTAATDIVDNGSDELPF
jgi:hypothetical protein